MVSISDIVVIVLLVLFTVIGFAKGILTKLLKPIAIATSAVLSYHIASPISALFIDTKMYANMASSIGEKASGFVLLFITGLILFILICIVLMILVNMLVKLIEKGKLLKVLNRLLGGVFGFATGLLLATVYLLIFFGLSETITSVNAFFIKDMGINPEHFTLSKALLDGTIKLFKSF